MICFTVEGCPVAKARARVTIKKGIVRGYTPTKTVNYENLIALYGKQVMALRLPLLGPISMGLSIYMGIPISWSKRKKRLAIQGDIYPTSKPDSSNIQKSVEDALNGICYLDDAQIVDHIITKRYSEFPRVEIRIYSVKRT
jgi:Holliday junction resolvase RusA-like endonuclease